MSARSMSGGATAFESKRPGRNEKLQKELEGIEVWQASCNGYDRTASGRIVTQWPCNFAEYRSRIDRDEISSFARGRASEGE